MYSNEDGKVLFPITTKEFIAHLKSRAEYHTKRNADYVAKAKKLEEDLKAGVDKQESTEDLMAYKSGSGYMNDARQRDNHLENARNQARLANKFNILLRFADRAGPQELQLTDDEMSNYEFFQE
jgi:hypothetical protein